MIISNLSNKDFYKNIDSKIKLCLDNAHKFDSATPCGKYVLSPDVYVNVSSFETKPMESAVAETHRRYADIQLILSGFEYIGYADTDDLTPVCDYDENNDIKFWKGNTALISMKKGDWALFTPGEAHAPGLNDAKITVKKAVFKIKY